MTARRNFLKRWALVIAASTSLLGALSPAHAQGAGSSPKIADDLRSVIVSTTGGVSGLLNNTLSWLGNIGGVPYVQALIVAGSNDTSLASLRADVLARGGSVFYNYISVRALSVTVPVSALDALAARSDVVGISPNRSTTRHASVLQTASGAGALPAAANGSTLDGRGVGIAILDSGIDSRHKSLLGPDGRTRVKQAVDIVGYSRLFTNAGWVKGVDLSPVTGTLLRAAATNLLSVLLTPVSNQGDPYGHGTHVATVAAGAGGYQSPDSSGIAPGADLYDVRVLDEHGVGNAADVLAGIDWVMQRARSANIRVVNLSLGAASNESFLTDPLARAVRSATATGLVVVVAAGNEGKNAAGQTVYGTISSPGHDPSVITVGASNMVGTGGRADDIMTGFSSRGPTRGATRYSNGNRWVDNLVKPDLVAPGNRLVAALATDNSGSTAGWNYLARTYPQLTQVAGANQARGKTLMELSGTSVAAPAVAGAVAVLLQANPGLTPPLVKAILQYTAQPLPDASLIEQGIGELNVDGAVRLAQSLRTDLSSALAAGTLKAGDRMLASGKTLPAATSKLNGQAVPWAAVATAGGTHLVGGDALFTRWQPIYDPALTWARQLALRSTVRWDPATLLSPGRTVPLSGERRQRRYTAAADSGRAPARRGGARHRRRRAGAADAGAHAGGARGRRRRRHAQRRLLVQRLCDQRRRRGAEPGLHPQRRFHPERGLHPQRRLHLERGLHPQRGFHPERRLHPQ